MLFVTRVGWFDPSHKLHSVSIGGDVEVLPCHNYPALSVLWLRDPARLSKSITCSECGLGAKAYWYCSDPGCHLALCPLCYSLALFPREPGVALATAAGGVSEGVMAGRGSASSKSVAPAAVVPAVFTATADAADVAHRFELPPPSSCRTLRPVPCLGYPLPFPDRLRAGQAVDRSHVLIPFFTVSLQGLGSDQPNRGTAATRYTRRTEAHNIGYGCYPLAVRWPPKCDEERIAYEIRRTAADMSDVRAERLLIDLRCHKTERSYCFGNLEYTANDVANRLLLPFLMGFSITKQVSRSPLVASDVLILFQCCCTSVDTFCTILGSLQQRSGVPVQMLVFDTPLLVYDIDALIAPSILPAFTNRLERRPLIAVLRSALSPDFLSTYRPELLTPPGVPGAPYARTPLWSPPEATPAVALVPAVPASHTNLLQDPVRCGAFEGGYRFALESVSNNLVPPLQGLAQPLVAGGPSVIRLTAPQLTTTSASTLSAAVADALPALPAAASGVPPSVRIPVPLAAAKKRLAAQAAARPLSTATASSPVARPPVPVAAVPVPTAAASPPVARPSVPVAAAVSPAPLSLADRSARVLADLRTLSSAQLAILGRTMSHSADAPLAAFLNLRLARLSGLPAGQPAPAPIRLSDDASSAADLALLAAVRVFLQSASGGALASAPVSPVRSRDPVPVSPARKRQRVSRGRAVDVAPAAPVPPQLPTGVDAAYPAVACYGTSILPLAGLSDLSRRNNAFMAFLGDFTVPEWQECRRRVTARGGPTHEVIAKFVNHYLFPVGYSRHMLVYFTPTRDMDRVLVSSVAAWLARAPVLPGTGGGPSSGSGGGAAAAGGGAPPAAGAGLTAPAPSGSVAGSSSCAAGLDFPSTSCAALLAPALIESASQRNELFMRFLSVISPGERDACDRLVLGPNGPDAVCVERLINHYLSVVFRLPAASDLLFHLREPRRPDDEQLFNAVCSWFMQEREHLARQSLLSSPSAPFVAGDLPSSVRAVMTLTERNAAFLAHFAALTAPALRALSTSVRTKQQIVDHINRSLPRVLGAASPPPPFAPVHARVSASGRIAEDQQLIATVHRGLAVHRRADSEDDAVSVPSASGVSTDSEDDPLDAVETARAIMKEVHRVARARTRPSTSVSEAASRLVPMGARPSTRRVSGRRRARSPSPPPPPPDVAAQQANRNARVRAYLEGLPVAALQVYAACPMLGVFRDSLLDALSQRALRVELLPEYLCMGSNSSNVQLNVEFYMFVSRFLEPHCPPRPLSAAAAAARASHAATPAPPAAAVPLPCLPASGSSPVAPVAAPPSTAGAHAFADSVLASPSATVAPLASPAPVASPTAPLP